MAGAYAAGETHFVEIQSRASRTQVAGFKVIVLDASVVVELLTNGRLSDSLRRDLAGRSDSFIAPHVLDVEVASALRKLVAGKRIDSHRTEQLLAGLATLPAERYAHTPLLGRIWELRHNFTCYDAAYIALAEVTDSVLYTSDARLSKGHRARVRVFTR
ncbi:MAG: type II toxin-antitoxin system VapC family toxin [Bryobacteraceae bacterium]